MAFGFCTGMFSSEPSNTFALATSSSYMQRRRAIIQLQITVTAWRQCTPCTPNLIRLKLCNKRSGKFFEQKSGVLNKEFLGSNKLDKHWHGGVYKNPLLKHAQTTRQIFTMLIRNSESAWVQEMNHFLHHALLASHEDIHCPMLQASPGPQRVDWGVWVSHNEAAVRWGKGCFPALRST